MIGNIRQEVEFQGKLADIGSLFKLQAAILWLLRTATLGLAADAGMLIVARYRAFTPPLWLLVAVPLGLALCGLFTGFLHRFSAQTVAARTDHRLGLKERLTTALELQKARDGSVLAQAQIDDAMWYLRRVEPWRAFPPRVPNREGLTMLGALLLTVALIALPNPAKSAIQHQAAVAAAIKQEAQKLQKTQNDITANRQQTGNNSQDQQTIEQILADLQKQLQQPSLTADEALAKLQQAQQKLQANQDPNADSLAEALQALAAEFDNNPLLQKVAQDIRNGDYNAAAKDLAAAGQQTSGLSQQQKDQLSASLKAAAAAQAKAGNSQLSDSLSQAADSLNGGSQADSTAAFQQASNNLQNAGQRSQAQQNLNKALGQVQQSEDAVAEQGGGQSASADPSQGANSDSSSSGGQDQSASSSAGGLGQSNSGQNGQGQGNQSGQGQGQGEGQGEGQGQGQGQKGNGDGRGSGGQGGETVYTGQGSTPQGVTGQEGSSGQISTSEDNSLSNPAQNGSNVPYQQVIGQYQQQASQAMDRQAVPLSYRQIVKDYFSSLNPRN